MLHSVQTRSISNEYSLLGRVCVGFQAEHLTECPRTRPQFHLKWGWAVGYEDRAATEQVRKMEGECFDFCLVVCFLFEITQLASTQSVVKS